VEVVSVTHLSFNLARETCALSLFLLLQLYAHNSITATACCGNILVGSSIPRKLPHVSTCLEEVASDLDLLDQLLSARGEAFACSNGNANRTYRT
jgi:hypothetical protein